MVLCEPLAVLFDRSELHCQPCLFDKLAHES